jgi:hypothetical protein
VGLYSASHLQSRCFTTWATPPVYFVLIILEMESRELFAWAGLELWSSQSQVPSSQNYRCEPLVPGWCIILFMCC